MKKLKQALRMDRCRCFRSPFFYLACAMMLVFWIITDIQAITAPPDSGAVLYLFEQRSAFALFASLPFATVFCEDFRNRFLWYSVQRANIRAYGPCASEYSARHALAIFQGRNSKVILERAYKICRLSNCMTKHKRRMFMYNE